MENTDNASQNTCSLCGGTKVLGQAGILHIYVLPHKLSLFLVFAGIVLGLTWSAYAFWLCLVGYLLPVFSADFRLLLYPLAALGKLLGKKPNCPKCEPSGAMFRQS